MKLKLLTTANFVVFTLQAFIENVSSDALKTNTALNELVLDVTPNGAVLRFFTGEVAQTVLASKFTILASVDGSTYYQVASNISPVASYDTYLLGNTFADYSTALNAAIASNATPYTPPTTSPAPTTPFPQTTEQITADKLRTEQIMFKLRNGEYINDDDSVFFTLGNSLMAQAAMIEVDAGRGFDGLRAIGLTQAQAYKVLSIFNIKMEVSKYESESALTRLLNDPTKIVSLKAFLDGKNLALPPLTSYLVTIRSNHAVYTAIGEWVG